MKQFFLVLFFPIIFTLAGCDDKADPFRNKSDAVRDAEVKPTADDPIPGISPNAMDITLVRDLDSLYFEEGVEYAYEVNVRLYLPNIDFEAELVGAPEGMTLELKSEFNGEVVTSPVDTDADITDAADEVTGDVANENDAEPASVANQKIYIIRWKPGFDTIPDVTIPSITRFLTFKVNVGADKVRTKSFRYNVNQATTKLKIAGFEIDPDLREGEKRGLAKIYVSYPGLLSTSKFPQIFIDTTSNSPVAACTNLPPLFELNSAKYIDDPKDPNFENIEYNYTVNLTKFDITTNSVSCNLNLFVVNLGNVSDPYPVNVVVLNTITDPETTWGENINLTFEQEKETAFYFQVYGVKNEGSIKVDFPTPCSQIFKRQGDCKCRTFKGYNYRHKVECLVEVNHKKTFSKQSYPIVFTAQMVNGPSASSKRITFRRTITFSPKGIGFFDVDGATDINDAETDAKGNELTQDQMKSRAQ